MPIGPKSLDESDPPGGTWTDDIRSENLQLHLTIEQLQKELADEAKKSGIMQDNQISLKPTTISLSWIPDHIEVNTITLDKGGAVALIKDLAEDLANTGIGKLVLRGSNGQIYIFRVK